MGKSQDKRTSEQLQKLLGHNLARRRLELGMSQERVAYLANLHRSEVSLVERGKRMPRGDTLFHLMGALELDLSQAFEGGTWAPFEGKPGGYLKQDSTPRR